MPAYGNDEISKRVKARFDEIFEREVSVFFVTTGTAANALALSAAVPPYGLCVCHREAHVIDDECGAPEFFMHGAKLAGLPGVGAKLKAEDVAAYLRSLPKAVKQMPPKALSISQVTRVRHGLRARRDRGPRRRSAASTAWPSTWTAPASSTRSWRSAARPAEMTWKQGVDILSFGATKNGGLMAEAIVVFRPDLAEALDYRSKRAGQIISKGRLIAAQFEGYFADDHWLDNARHANRMAQAALGGACSAFPASGSPGRRRPTRCSRSSRKTLDRALKAAGIHLPSLDGAEPARDRAGGGSTRS